MSLYIAWSSASPTTVSQAVTATGTGIKTMLQVLTPATQDIEVIEWGISFDGSAAATPGICELMIADVAATTGTSFTPAKYGVGAQGRASLCVGGTGATGFGFSAEGTITAVTMLDAQLISPTVQYVKQFPLGREPWVPVSKSLRIRVKFGTTVNALAYVIWDE